MWTPLRSGDVRSSSEQRQRSLVRLSGAHGGACAEDDVGDDALADRCRLDGDGLGKSGDDLQAVLADAGGVRGLGGRQHRAAVPQLDLQHAAMDPQMQ